MHQWDPDASDYQQLDKSLTGDAGNDHFGYTIDLARDGKTVIVGAYSNEKNTGQVKIFSLADAHWNMFRQGKVSSQFKRALLTDDHLQSLA